jgi:hypothetical protein
MLIPPLLSDTTRQRLAADIAGRWIAAQHDAPAFATILASHERFLSALHLPLYPITVAKVSIDLARRVLLPCAVDLHNTNTTTRATGDPPLEGFWEKSEAERMLAVLREIGLATATLWPNTSSLVHPISEYPSLVQILAAAQHSE